MEQTINAERHSSWRHHGQHQRQQQQQQQRRRRRRQRFQSAFIVSSSVMS